MPDTPKPGTPLPELQKGLAGGCNVVTFNGEDVTGIAWVRPPFADAVIHACNTLPKLEAKLAELEKPCVWTWDRESWGWRASCRKALSDVKQGPPSNKFCGHCGHPITEDSEA